MQNKQKKIKDISIDIQEPVLNALKKMDITYKRLLLVFDKDQFNSLISIGDIQRAIIRNEPLETPIKNILRKKPRFAYEDEDFISIKDAMLKYRAECMPVLNRNQQLVDVLFWEDVFPQTEKRIKTHLGLPVVIMAGGIGSRLKPLTNVLPKPLIPIGDKTMLEEIFDRFANYECTDFYISVNYKADLIEYYIKSQGLPYNISFFKEENPLGTAGSLGLLKGVIKKTFFVTNCDILIEQDYSEILDYHRKNNNEITIVAALKHYPIPYGIIETGENGQLLELTEKPELTFKINSGMYVLEPHLLSEIPSDTFFHITQLIENIKKRKGRIGVYPVSEKSWKDLGDWSEYRIYLK